MTEKRRSDNVRNRKKQRRTLVCVRRACARRKAGSGRGRPWVRGGKTGHRQDRAGVHVGKGGGGASAAECLWFPQTKPRARHGGSGRAEDESPQHRPRHTTPPRGPESRREHDVGAHRDDTTWGRERTSPEPTFSSPWPSPIGSPAPRAPPPPTRPRPVPAPAPPGTPRHPDTPGHHLPRPR